MSYKPVNVRVMQHCFDRGSEPSQAIALLSSLKIHPGYGKDRNSKKFESRHSVVTSKHAPLSLHKYSVEVDSQTAERCAAYHWKQYF